MEEEPKVFSTRDLYLASTLVTMHFPLLVISYQVEGIKLRPIGYFEFAETKELSKARSDYNQGLLLVEPRLYMSNLQSLKAEVTNMFQNPNSKINQGMK